METVNRAFFDAYLDAWNAHNAAAVARHMADDAIYEDVALGRVMHGPSEIASFVEEATRSSSDFRFEVVSLFMAGTDYANEWVMVGTNDREVRGVPPTGRSFRVRGASIGKLDASGRIAENRDYYNLGELLTQLGILPTATVATWVSTSAAEGIPVGKEDTVRTIKAFIKKHPVLTYYALVFAISWGGILLIVGGPGEIPGSSEQVERLMPLVLLALFAGPSVAGILTTGFVSGRAGLRELLSRLLRWRVRARWYAAALLPAPLVVTTVLLALSLFSPEFIPGIVTNDNKIALLLFGIGWGLLGGGLLEELGWTGFAVPRLRLRYTAFTTALIVGLLHGTWHFLIAFWAGGSFSGGQWTTYLLGILFFYLGALPAYRVLMVWVYDRTASLLVAMLMHASLSASTLILQPPLTGVLFLTWNLTLTAILWVVVAAVALGNGGQASRQPLRRRAA